MPEFPAVRFTSHNFDRSGSQEVGTGGRSVGACGFTGKYHLHDQESLHFSRGVHVYRRVRKYVVQTHIEQGNPALQTSRQDALLREGRAGRMALAKLRTYGGRCHAYGDGSIRNPTVL